VTPFSIQSVFFYLSSQSALIRYGLALLVVLATSFVTISMPVIGERAAFLLFFFGIIQVSFWLGVYPGIFTGLLSLASVNLFVLAPSAITVGDSVVLNTGFCFVSVVMIFTTSFHRQLAQALWESRQDLAHAQTVGQIGSWRLNVARNELTWSDENHRIFGIPPNTPMSYETFLAVVHPDDRDYVDRMWQAGLRGAPYDIEHRLIVADKVKWVREKAILEFDNKGTLLGGFGITQDVTRRKDLQDQLAKVAASVPGLICSFRLRPDGSACMPYASPVIESIYGMGLDVVSEDFSPVFARIHPDDIDHIHASIAESASTQKPWRDRYRYKHPSKGEVWHEGHSQPIREADGSILWHGYVHDVTELVLAEKVLQERIDRYELVLNGAQDAIWDWDVVERRVNYSSRWKALRGYAEHEIGEDEQEWSNNIHPDDLERVLAAVQHHFAGQTPVFCEEYRIRCRDGSWKWVLDRGLARHDDQGRVIRMAGSESDITERKLAENALRDRESQLRLIMDATPALISYLDLDFRYVRVNATYEKWFGISAEQILGRKAEEIIGASAWQVVGSYLQRARAGEPVSFDQQIPYGKGIPRWVHATYLPNIDTNGLVRGIVVHVFDIEERVVSEQKITLLNQRLRRRIQEMQVIFNTVPIGISIAEDSDGQHIRGNSVIEHLLGLPPNSELSMRDNANADLCIKQNDLDLAIDELPMQRAIRGERVSNQLIEVIRPDQKSITLLCNTSPLLNEDGLPRGAVGAFLDITPLRQAQQSLEKSQLQLRLLVEQAPLCIAMFDSNMNFLVTSRRWVEAFGRGYDDLVGRNHYIINHDLPLAWKQIHQRVLSGECLRYNDDLWVQADGSQHWFDWAAYPWTNTSGEIGGIIISCDDVTARRKAELELRNSEARLSLIVDQVKAGYWDWDLNGHQLFLSPEAKQQIGFDDSDVPTRKEDWVARLHPEDRDFVMKLLDDYVANLQSHYEVEFRFLHQDGNYRWFHSRGVMFSDEENHPCRMLGINFDTTEYMKQKRINAQRDKMEQSFRLYVAVQTAAAIAHELNQPLSAISSYADVALQMVQTRSSNHQKLEQLIENCSTQAQRAGEVIRQLLALLQKEENPTEQIDINVVVHEAINLFEIDTQADTFKVETDLAADLPPVSANAMQIQKVLINLFRNGYESMQEQGKNANKIVVITRRSTLNSSMVQVTVQDSGVGVADNTLLKKIFQPFYTSKPKGLGMGLVISRSLITAHGGKMWAEQNISQGLSMHFTLPFAE
jgi:PAS domain S-box-containing protein